MKSPIWYLFKKEMIEIRRGNVLRILILAPLVQTIIFGYVATTDITHVTTLVCDEDNSAESRALADRFLHTEYFDVRRMTRTPPDIQPALTRNTAKIALRIPKDFSRDIKRGKNVKVQLIVDGSDSNMASIALNRAAAIVTAYSASAFAERLAVMKNVVGPLPEAVMEERVWYNPELKSAVTMVPGVLGLILLTVSLIVTALSLVREKESGNIEQVIVTPVKPWQIIAGKIGPYIVISLVDVVLITLLGLIVFGLPLRGNFLLLLFLSLFMILANLGLGIFVSTVSSTQQQAMLSSIFLILPNMLLSGFIFPIKNMPEVLQALTYLVPLRYYMVIIRGIFLKGLGFIDLFPQFLALCLFSAVIFLLALLRFRKKLS